MVVCKVVLATSGAPGVKTKNSTHGNNERCVAAPSAPEVKVAPMKMLASFCTPAPVASVAAAAVTLPSGALVQVVGPLGALVLEPAATSGPMADVLLPGLACRRAVSEI